MLYSCLAQHAFSYTCMIVFYYIKLKSRLSVCLSCTPITQSCLHGLKPDLSSAIAMSSGISKFISKSFYKLCFFQTTARWTLVLMKTAINHRNLAEHSVLYWMVFPLSDVQSCRVFLRAQSSARLCFLFI